jgi:2-polyprenyl-3-methyl-5-hydroxy-6-metoxy-1,4-benzoquinol methylase
MAKVDSRKQKQPSKSVSDRRVDKYLRDLGIGPISDPETFWWSMSSLFGEKADRFQQLMWKRTHSEYGSAALVRCMNEQYRVKNSSLDFSIVLSSYFVGGFFGGLLKFVSGLSFESPPRRILDIGCDNGILTAYYALLFPQATVVGVDRCRQAIACATELKDRFELTNLSFVHGNPLQARQPRALGKEKWDLVLMSMCGYEESTRHANTESQIADQFMNCLAPDGTGIVVEPPNSALLECLVGRARSGKVHSLPFGNASTSKATVKCAVLRARQQKLPAL